MSEAFILEELRDLRKQLIRMNETLSVNTESLRTHIRRTELLEQATIKLDGRLSELEIKNIERNAIKNWVRNTIILYAKIIAGAGAFVGAVMGLPIVAEWLLKILM